MLRRQRQYGGEREEKETKACHVGTTVRYYSTVEAPMTPTNHWGGLLRRHAAAGLAVAAGNNVLGQNNCLSQIAHGAPQPPALIAQAEVRSLLAQLVFRLQNTLGALHQLAGFELALHFLRLFLKAHILLGQPRLRDGPADLFAHERHQRNFRGRVRARLLMMHIDYANDIASANQRY